MRRVSGKDVAAAAGVSPATVSLVLNGKADADIPEATRNRVLQAARDLRYTRNSAARALITGKTGRIGVLLNSPYGLNSEEPFYSRLLAGIIDALVLAEQSLVVYTRQWKSEDAVYEEILSGSADGVLVVGNYGSPEFTRRLLDSTLPTVFVSHHPGHPEALTVDCDNVQVGSVATRHLIQLGHREFGILAEAGDFETSWMKDRIMGMRQALADLAEPWALNPVVYESVFGSGFDPAIDHLLDQKPKPTALFVFSEYIARGLIERLPERGYSVPRDFSIISCNSTTLSERTQPPQTSVYQPLDQVGYIATELLLRSIEGISIPDRSIKVPIRLDIRQTTGPASPGQR